MVYDFMEEFRYASKGSLILLEELRYHSRKLMIPLDGFRNPSKGFKIPLEGFRYGYMGNLKPKGVSEYLNPSNKPP